MFILYVEPLLILHFVVYLKECCCNLMTERIIMQEVKLLKIELYIPNLYQISWNHLNPGGPDP